MSRAGKFDAAALERLREEHAVSDVLQRLGVKLRRAGREWVGLSPFRPEKTPSFTVNDEKGFWHDFGSGEHGDVFDAVVQLRGCTFPEAVEWLGGAREVTPEERDRITQKRREQDEAEKSETVKTRARAERAFQAAKPIEGTHAAAYLEARGLAVLPCWTFDLRFLVMPYRGYQTAQSDKTVLLGEYPAMVAAIRDVGGSIIGIHRTYLDPKEPRKLVVGDATRNAAKKVFGDVAGGMIWLSEPTARLGLGEGIETVRSWFVLGRGGDDISIASAVSLGNLSGSATAQIRHPRIKDRWVANGEPDMDRPGVILPPDVLEVALIGDGDSEPVGTRARMLVAGRRFRQQGRQVSVDMAPDGKDFNSVLQESGE